MDGAENINACAVQSQREIGSGGAGAGCGLGGAVKGAMGALYGGGLRAQHRWDLQRDLMLIWVNG